jgi:hypothetical protein
VGNADGDPLSERKLRCQNLSRSSIPNRHDTGSTTARSVDEVALIRNTISHYAPVLIALLSIPRVPLRGMNFFWLLTDAQGGKYAETMEFEAARFYRTAARLGMGTPMVGPV